ncbi:DEAD/DEAH box helicase [Deinococcus humi]|uniref:Superfamily II DNA or RNA helicase n=1 Tax=Deinococcus humi TaxID=662880 RepID=A0A7W8JZC0_9DEIO|nr:DEAD/DEAH box helicase family protein [Deinococcus humi]MBB5365944.1 superfamily II DNA or RNA helicase [Deinococcus humi]GGO41806.1 hypothetical protein GCM10008949_53090 [Deinococcus humi]
MTAPDPSYFQEHAGKVTLLGSADERLRNNQIGAIGAVQAHFSLSDQPALVAMPTGTGKSAVLIVLAFLLQARRVLVITPSIVVREQIAEGFQTLTILKKTGTLPPDCPEPVVTQVEGYLSDTAAWEALRTADVVVASPPSVSPSPGRVIEPPDELFDLVLVDEAHHAEAPTWKSLLDHFPKARRVLCSATPFRNDRQTLGARIVYHYPLRRAQRENIFSEITFVPVTASTPEDADIAIAQQAQAMFERDQAAGLDHRVMVRTTQKNRAKALKQVYTDHTTLKLEEVHSGMTLKTIKARLKKLREGELDGVIAVDMMGEGFDFPNLKIAAIHAPHKSLPVTLQFIGRFARTGFKGQPIGDATFIAEENSIRHDEYSLYSPDEPDWGEIIANLGDRRVQKEVARQEFFDTFLKTVTSADDTDPISRLALGHFEPFFHVKIYQLPDPAGFELEASPQGLTVQYAEVSRDLNVSAMVWVSGQKPRWLRPSLLQDVKYHLLIVYFDQPSNLMFVCSTLKEDDIYDLVLDSFAPPGAHEIAAPLLRRVMTDWKDPELYSIGMRNRQAAIGQESYRMLSGGAAHHAVSKRDGKRFTRGHAFGASVEGAGKKTLGISSNYAKVWSLQNGDLSKLVVWCQALAAKLADPASDTKTTPLDMLDGGQIITSFPDSSQHTLIMADWPAKIYKAAGRSKTLHLTSPAQPGGKTVHPLELELRVRPDQCTHDTLRFDVHCFSETVECQLKLEPLPRHSVLPGQTCTLESLSAGKKAGTFAEFLDGHAPEFWFEDLTTVTRNVQYAPIDFDERVPADTFERVDWTAAKVDIKAEITAKQPGTISIQEYLRQRLEGQHQVVFFDHETGEAADFITLDATGDPQRPIVMHFCHCKGSSEVKAGSRVEDMYEVLGQCIKCMRYRDRNALRAHLIDREKKYQAAGSGSRYVTGDAMMMTTILSTPGSLVLPITVWAVQPGLNSTKATMEADPKMHRLIDGIQSLLIEQGSLLKVMCT